MPDLTGKTAIVTGAASGMGAACARLLAAAGAHVVIVDLDRPAAEATATAIGAGPPVCGDISDSAFCASAVAEATRRHGGPHVLVNAAGAILRADALGTSDEAWARVMRVNVDGTFFMCRAAIAAMREGDGGAIVNFSSIWGDIAGPGALAYCASKGAVTVMTRALALDHAREGIRVNAVMPGEVDTPMLRAGGRSTPLSDAEIAAIGDRAVPMGRVAQPEEIARAVVFLASDDASYITGAVVPVDGGYAAR